MGAIFVYTGNHSIPLWCKYYHLVSNTIHRLFPTANQSVFIYNNTQIRLFMVSKVKSVIFCSSNVSSDKPMVHIKVVLILGKIDYHPKDSVLDLRLEEEDLQQIPFFKQSRKMKDNLVMLMKKISF